MLKLASLLAMACLAGSAAFAQPGSTHGVIELTHGWVKGADGTKISVKGLKLPCIIHPIYADNLTPASASPKTLSQALDQALQPRRYPAQMGPEADSVIYQADAGLGYGYIEGNPSSLDDITIAGSGLGKPWTKLKFGFNTSLGLNPRFLVRWRIFGTNTDFPAPQNDFTDEIADFGGVFQSPIPSTQVVVEVDITQAGVLSTDDTLFIAQQFREFSNPPTPQQLLGEGEFMYGAVDTVFNAFAPPTVGSSDGTIFWYDWDPFPDGNYENTEIDTFENAQANHVLGITVNASGSSQSFNPISAEASYGWNPTGNFLSTWIAGDGDVFAVLPRFDYGRMDPNGAIDVEVPAPATFTAFRAEGLAGIEVPQMNQKVQAFHAATGTWVTLAESTVGLGVNSFNGAYGGTLPLAGFKQANGRIKFRVRWDSPPNDTGRSFKMYIDMFRVWYTS